MEREIRIAIIGGGLAGVSLANMLAKNSRLDVHVYESKEFSERGASVGLARNALTAMERIVPSAMDTLVERAGAVPTESIRVAIGSGPETGEFLFEVPDIKPRVSVPRSSLLMELLARLPQHILHSNMKLESIDQDSIGSFTVTFKCGTTETFDAVIGADGIASSVRDYVLGGEERASPTGFWDCWAAFPVGEIRENVGEELVKPGQQYAFTSPGLLLLYTLVNGGSTTMAVISGVEDAGENREARKQDITDEQKESLRGRWDVARGIVERVLSAPSLQAYSQYEHKSTKTYYKGNVCLIGDAAHACSPWQGAGAGQALEDCAVLSTLLHTVSDPKELSKAFQAFESVRMPRCKKVIESSREVGNILCGQGKFESLEAWREALKSKWDFLHQFNLEEQEAEALGMLRSLIADGGDVEAVLF